MGIRKRILSLSLVALMIGAILPNIKVQASDIKDGALYKKEYEEVKNYDSYGNLRLYSNFKTSSLLDEREEVRESRLANSKIRKLVLQTNSNYEVALAYSDGNYSYVNKFDDLEEAINECKSIEKEINESENIIPVVIDKSGQVTYATKSVARVRKYVNGKIVSGTSDIYTDSSMRNVYTYVSHDYMSEVPLITTSGQAAKVLIGGYEGWMKYTNKDDYANKTADVVIWPLNQVTTPSYYIVQDGILKHWAGTSLDGGSGTMLYVGSAPDFLEPGKKYASYDGNYFYYADNIQDAIWDLTLDLKENTKKRAVNNGNPYYSYFNNLSFRSKSNYTADDINRYITAHTASDSKLRNLGAALKEAENTYGVNALLTLSVAINESGWGQSRIAKDKNNLFGMGAIDSDPYNGAYSYPSTRESVLDFTQNFISNGYANPRDWRYWGSFLGNKNLGANVKYASDPFWGEKAASFAMQIDYYLSGNNVKNLKDENYYQLIKYVGTNKVIGADGTEFYDIATTNVSVGGSSTIGTSVVGTNAIQATGKKVTINGEEYIEIYADRNHSKYDGNFNGTYNWSKLGYTKNKNIVFLNKGKTGFKEGDINFDDEIDMKDLSLVSNLYNSKKGDSNWNNNCDLNNDGIIDIYDIVKVANKITG